MKKGAIHRKRLFGFCVRARITTDEDGGWRYDVLITGPESLASMEPEDILETMHDLCLLRPVRYAGPGGKYSHAPSVHHPVVIDSRVFVKVTQSGGLDV